MVLLNSNVSRDLYLIWFFTYGVGTRAMYGILNISNMRYHIYIMHVCLVLDTYWLHGITVKMLHILIVDKNHNSLQAMFMGVSFVMYLISPVHYSDVIIRAIACQITGVTIVYSTVNSSSDKKKYIKNPRHWPLCGDRWIPHKWTVMRKMLHLVTSSCHITFPLKSVFRWVAAIPCSATFRLDLDLAVIMYLFTFDSVASLILGPM